MCFQHFTTFSCGHVVATACPRWCRYDSVERRTRALCVRRGGEGGLILQMDKEEEEGSSDGYDADVDTDTEEAVVASREDLGGTPAAGLDSAVALYDPVLQMLDAREHGAIWEVHFDPQLFCSADMRRSAE